jgi:hypothetical protein
MLADITLANVAFEGIASGQRIRVRNGEKFIVRMNDVAPEAVEWASSARDKVLDLDEGEELLLTVKASTVGNSKVFILDYALTSVFHIDVEVYDTAASLNISAGAPELK